MDLNIPCFISSTFFQIYSTWRTTNRSVMPNLKPISIHCYLHHHSTAWTQKGLYSPNSSPIIIDNNWSLKVKTPPPLSCWPITGWCQKNITFSFLQSKQRNSAVQWFRCKPFAQKIKQQWIRWRTDERWPRTNLSHRPDTAVSTYTAKSVRTETSKCDHYVLTITWRLSLYCNRNSIVSLKIYTSSTVGIF